MIDYATVAQEILETPPRQPDWVRERIGESDELRDRLEEINLREGNQQEAIALHNKQQPDDKQEFVQRRVPHLLRLQVVHLVDQLEDFERPVPYLPIPLLDLVFEIQEALFELGGYRQLRCPSCGAPSGLHISTALEERERYQCQRCQHVMEVVLR